MQREHLKRKVVKTGNMTLTLVDLQGELRMSIMDESSTNHQEREQSKKTTDSEEEGGLYLVSETEMRKS